MKPSTCLIVLFCLIFSPALLAQYQTLVHDGMNRQYLYHEPVNLPAGAPLVFVLHGFTGDADDIRNYSGMNQVANNYGFAVCYPRGSTDQSGNRFFNVGYDFHGNETVDDIDYLVQLASFLQNTHSLDPQRTFVTGFSNGGDMSYYLGCEASSTFKAIAPVAGMQLDHITTNCSANTAVPVFEIHGTADNVTLYYGDPNNNDGWGAYPSLPNTISWWSSFNACTNIQTGALPDIDPNDGSFVEFEKHTGGVNGNQVWLYTVVGGGHDWPGTWGNMDINTSEEIWWFFNQVGNANGAHESSLAPSLSAYPNPVQHAVTLSVPANLIGDAYELLDMTGRSVKKAQFTQVNERLDLSDLATGVYTLQVVNDPENSLKLVKR